MGNATDARQPDPIWGLFAALFIADVMLLTKIGFGVMGWVLKKLDVPLVQIILGTLLGNAMENNLRRAITTDNGNRWPLIDSPLSIALWSLAVIGFLLPILLGRVLMARMKHRKKDGERATID
jgi:putative tricarboxylic transport membrane protein